MAVAVFNGENFLRETLDALLCQTFEDFELIICDNASTDATRDIAREFAARDKRVRYFANDMNIGMSANYNRAFGLARGEYFKWADHDDLCAPEYLDRCVKVLDDRPDVVLCDVIPSDIDVNRRVLAVYDKLLHTDDPRPQRRFYELLHADHDRKQITGLIRAGALRQTRLHEPYPTADLVLIARLALTGRFYRVREPLFFYRRHPEQTVSFSRFARYPRLEPSKRGRITFPELEAYAGLARSVADADLTLAQRVACYSILLRWPTWHGNVRLMAKDVGRAGLILAGRRHVPMAVSDLA